MPHIPIQVKRDRVMAKWIKEIGPEAARAKAMADLTAGAVPPWREHREIILTSYLVRKRLREELPEPEKEGGRLYVLGFQGLRPVVKVGSTGNTEGQFDTYEIQARNLGFALLDGWVSAPVGTRKEAFKQESTILSLLHQVLNGHIVGGRIFEWFHGHDFERIKELVQHPDVLLEQYLSTFPVRPPV
ncbi:hypothetical protein [Streptomyces sp. NPDC048332]|uniref:hypothetical protein n=1 Tax=unclassified Streptomyces TaxID=2593676 RepID=UPI0034353258